MKKIIFLIVNLVCILIMNKVLAADVEVQINGDIIQFDDTSAQIINDRTMVPFRKIFNELGVSNENISWDGETKTIIAKKSTTEIELQIGNNIAKKRVGSTFDKITLDSAPVIRNDRTLVPLRFIAESLGKTVGWDANSRTAIIIDYDFFMNELRKKSEPLYNFLMNNSKDVSVSMTRNYTDSNNSSNDNTAIVKAEIVETSNGNSINQKVNLSFSGNNELMKDIQSEGWAEVSYENEYNDENFTTKALTDGLKKVYGQEKMDFSYDILKCNGKPMDTITDWIKSSCAINEETLNIQTFKDRKEEFINFLNMFKSANGNLSTGNITSNNISLNYFDFTKLDNTLLDTPINRVFSFWNSLIFHYDITLDELCYDYPKMNLSIDINNLELTIDFIMSNEYNEKVEYVIKINKR